MNDLEYEASCRDFIVRCLRALDDRDYEAVADGFAEDGVWDRGGEQLVGPGAVREAMARRPVDLQTQHLVFNMVVDRVSADVATVLYTIAAYAKMADKPSHLHGMFRATDQLVRTTAGWRFRHRAVTPAFAGEG